MTKLYFTPLFFPIFFFATGNIQAQSESQDSVASRPVQEAIKLYHKTLGTYAHVFNGTEYIGLTTPSDGHPFFHSNKFADGSIVYDGLLYPQVSLLYDVVDDFVIVKHQDDAGLLNQIQVEKTRVSRFGMSGHTFVRIDESKGAVSPGFYDELYAGDNVQVLAKRNKYAKMEVVVMTYKDMDSYVIRKGDQYYSVRSKGSVLKVFKDRKKEVSQYMRENNITFHLDREAAMVKMAAYYDTLNN